MSQYTKTPGHGATDCVDGDKTKLTKSDPVARRHYLPKSWVSLVDDRVHLNKDVEETKHLWEEEAHASL